MYIRVTFWIIFLWLNCGSFCTKAQQPGIKLATGIEASLASLDFDGNQFVFQGQVNELKLSFLAGADDHLSISMPGYFLTGQTGYPALPQKPILFDASDNEVARIRIDHLDSMIFDLGQMGITRRVSPYQPSFRKGDLDEFTFLDSMAYSKDTWLGGPLLNVTYEGIMRGLPLSTLRFNPVRYNPARNLMKVYINVSGTIELKTQPKREHVPSEAFEGLFNRVVKQGSDKVKKAVFSEQPMTLIILSDTMFRETLEPFIHWKSLKGFNVVEAYSQDPSVGSSRESIKSYLKTLYTSPGEGGSTPTYLLIVGDVEHIPLSQSSGQITDLYYATYDGEGDFIPDLFYGRISVATEAQLQAILNKVLEYEQYKFPDPSFLDESVLIAGVDGSFARTHGNGQINYALTYYLNETNGNNPHSFLYPESGSSDIEILDIISNGVGFVNYTGHGLYDRWIDPTFHQNDIDALENLGKYPVMIGNGCETNVFNLGECFAEALIRAPEKGALAYIGCTNDSYWDEDYFWAVGVGPIVANPLYEETSRAYYDKVFHSHGESYENWTPSLGEMIFGGNMSVQQSNSSRKKFYWEIYQLAGDPTIVPWFSQPAFREVSYPGILPIGSSRMDVMCAPYDYVALSKNGNLMDALHASHEGYATLFFPDTVQDGTLDLVVSGDRYIPFVGEVMLGTPPDPYLDLEGYELSDESVELDGKISMDEIFSLDMRWINRGADALMNDTLVLSSGHADITLLDSVVVLERLEPGDTVSINNVFKISSGHQVRDQEPITLGLSWKGGMKDHTVFLKEKIVAPVLVTGGISWDDRPLGNGNGIAEEGEWLLCQWTLKNAGHFRTGILQGSYKPRGASMFEQIEFEPFPIMEAGDSIMITFRARVADPVTGLPLAGPFSIGDNHVSLKDSFMLSTAGHFEDFSERGTENYPFTNTSASHWNEDNEIYASSPKALKSGSISNNGISEISISFETGVEDTLSFAYKISSEPGYDFLHLFADSVMLMSWSGEKGWDRYSHVLEPGHHEITWSYRKDQSISRGQDAAWIDDIVFPASAFRQYDLSLVRVLQPLSGPWLTNQEQVILLVRNTGMDTIPGFSVAVTLDNQPESLDTIAVPIPAGHELEYVVLRSFDLSEMDIHNLSAKISVENDQYKGNNQLKMEVERYQFPDLAISMIQLDELEGIRAEALLAIENSGNIRIDSLRYEIWLDGSLKISDSKYIGLENKQVVNDTFRLLDSTDHHLSTGYHEYLIRSTNEDSIPTNNEVSGNLFWHSLGTIPSDKSRLLIYPNPAKYGFQLRLPQPAYQDMKVEMVNIKGQLEAIFMIEKSSVQLNIPVSSLAPGNYLLRIPEIDVSLPVLISD